MNYADKKFMYESLTDNEKMLFNTIDKHFADTKNVKKYNYVNVLNALVSKHDRNFHTKIKNFGIKAVMLGIFISMSIVALIIITMTL